MIDGFSKYFVMVIWWNAELEVVAQERAQYLNDVRVSELDEGSYGVFSFAEFFFE
jgi:hypothetical protein